MKKLGIVEWAALSEVAGTIAVIISLIFVAVSLDRNTAAVEATNEDFTYDLADRYLAEQVNNPALFEIRRKVLNGEQVTDLERWQFESQLQRYLNNWERLFVRHADGLMAETTLAGWNQEARTWLRSNMTQEIWEDFKGTGYRADFEAQVDALLAEY